MSVVLVSVGSTVRFNVARESHPVTAHVSVADRHTHAVNLIQIQV